MKLLTTTLSALALSATLAMAQTVSEEKTTTTQSGAGGASKTTTTTTTSTGTISEYAPGTTFIVKESAGPVTYKYGNSVTYVTKSGKTLTEEQVKSRIKVGVPVSVHYSGTGDARTVERVEVDDDGEVEIEKKKD